MAETKHIDVRFARYRWLQEPDLDPINKEISKSVSEVVGSLLCTLSWGDFAVELHDPDSDCETLLKYDLGKMVAEAIAECVDDADCHNLIILSGYVKNFRAMADLIETTFPNLAELEREA